MRAKNCPNPKNVKENVKKCTGYRRDGALVYECAICEAYANYRNEKFGANDFKN